MRLLALLLMTTPLLLTAPAFAEVPKVETDIPPVAALVAQVMGNLGQPGMLLDKGGDEHDLQLRPSQMRDLSTANLIVWIGPELTPGLAEAVSAAGQPSLTLLDAPGTTRLDYTNGGVNPHAWLDPANARLWLGLIATELARLDPEHATTYLANAATADSDIAKLDAAIATRLAHLRPFVTHHDAYAYFAGHYHLPYLGGLAAGDAAPPGAARLADLHDKADLGVIACAFPEAQHDPAMIDSLAQGTSLLIGPPLDPVGSTLDPGPGAYDQLMIALTDSLAKCADNP